jgi:hypothetical protein
MGWLKAPYDQQHILSLEYVFILRSPSIITEANYDRICNLEGIQLTVVRSFNYFNYLLNRQGVRGLHI